MAGQVKERPFVIVDPQKIEWQTHKPSLNPQEVNYAGGKVPAWEGPPKVRYKELFTASPGKPRVVVAEWEPNHREPTHSHPVSEWMYVLAGSATLNGQPLETGGMFFIQKDTMYSLAAGPQGLRFLRFTL